MVFIPHVYHASHYSEHSSSEEHYSHDEESTTPVYLFPHSYYNWHTTTNTIGTNAPVITEVNDGLTTQAQGEIFWIPVFIILFGIIVIAWLNRD